MKLVKKIESKKGELHFKRWRLFKIPFTDKILFIHGIYMHDLDEHMHNHPWNIWTMIIWGKYIEKYLDSEGQVRYSFRGWLHTAKRNSEEFHKIDVLGSKKVFTIAVMGPRKEEPWGYHTDNGFVDHITYRKRKNRGD